MAIPNYVKDVIKLVKGYEYLGQPFSESVTRRADGYKVVLNDEFVLYISYRDGKYSLGYRVYQSQYKGLTYDEFMGLIIQELEAVSRYYQEDLSNVNQFKDELESKGFNSDSKIWFKYKYSDFIQVTVDRLHHDYSIKFNGEFIYSSKEFNYDDMSAILNQVLDVVDSIQQLDDVHTKIKNKLLDDLTNSIVLNNGK